MNEVLLEEESISYSPVENSLVRLKRFNLRDNEDYSNKRYMISYIPSAVSDLWHLGCLLHGYNAELSRQIQPVELGVISTIEWLRFVNLPALNGFQAPLKNPFRLTKGEHEADLFIHLYNFKSKQKPIKMPRLVFSDLGDSIVLKPEKQSLDINVFAYDCTVYFDKFRPPCNEDDLKAYNLKNLTSKQLTYLHMFGNPYLLDDFQFQFKIAEPIFDKILRHALIDKLNQILNDGINLPTTLDSIALLSQRDEYSPFLLEQRFYFPTERDKV
jgi:hypothetical protein